jgi:purine-binding chemotaxis protein CheW
MSRAELAMEEAVHPSPETANKIMRDRAVKLSQASLKSESAEAGLEVLVFELGGERYALETGRILEVFPLTNFTPVPGVPDFLVGVTPYRGEILALVDLRKLFGMEVKGVTDLSRIVVLGVKKAQCGILVDKAQEVILLQPEEIIDQKPYSTGLEGKYFRGVTREALIVIDGDGLLKDARLIIRQDEEAELVSY